MDALDDAGLIEVDADRTISVVWSLRYRAGGWQPWMANTFRNLRN